MFKISEFSELTNISPRMLRHYDKLNVLKPKTIQKENGSVITLLNRSIKPIKFFHSKLLVFH